MKAPSLTEVRSYWIESNLVGDPAEFYDHFESNGWMVGKSPMKDWQAAARNWSRNEVKWANGQRGQSGHVTKPPEPSDIYVGEPASPERAEYLSRLRQRR